MSEVLQALDTILALRRDADPEQSYVASLHVQGLNKILEKLGEECVETLLAAKDADRDATATQALVNETADLWFHSLVMLSHLGLSSREVLEELQRRFDVSGLDEKAARQ